MKIKIKVTTPKGAAKGSQAMLSKLLFGFDKPLSVNITDSSIIWQLDVNTRRYMKIQKNVMRFGLIGKAFLDRRLVEKGLKKLADTPEDFDKVKEMLVNGTKVTIIND
jgi:hypothetical protein